MKTILGRNFLRKLTEKNVWSKTIFENGYGMDKKHQKGKLSDSINEIG